MIGERELERPHSSPTILVSCCSGVQIGSPLGRPKISNMRPDSAVNVSKVYGSPRRAR